MGLFRLVTGLPGPSGFGSASTGEQVTDGMDASHLTVVITARNMEAADDVKQLILQTTPLARVDVLKLDLSSLKSVRAFADQFLAMDLPLNILMYRYVPPGRVVVVITYPRMRLLKLFTYVFWKTVPQGAATTCYVALHPSLKGVTGKYFIDCNEEMPSYWAKDETLAKKLWDLSEKLSSIDQVKQCSSFLLQD
ncbi:hypothetical protein B296_00041240 [Ensete ventricosum]|uniref:Uncharacterized protein n=1 Tax=Ensete ventricosum TaxID=4639 RepID=A0A426XR79_ENSVE|nr:hypothetical protein B296_00041240 [Ensete ventricosum]